VQEGRRSNPNSLFEKGRLRGILTRGEGLKGEGFVNTLLLILPYDYDTITIVNFTPQRSHWNKNQNGNLK